MSAITEVKYHGAITNNSYIKRDTKGVVFPVLATDWKRGGGTIVCYELICMDSHDLDINHDVSPTLLGGGNDKARVPIVIGIDLYNRTTTGGGITHSTVNGKFQ